MFSIKFITKAAIDRLAKNERGLAQKIADKFKEILNVIRTKLKMMGEISNNNPEIKALMDDADSLEQIVNKFHDALDVAKNNYNVQESGKDAGKVSFSYTKQLENNKNKKYNKSIYNEFNTLVMQWRYKFDTKVGDCNIFSIKSDIFALIEATDDGYIEIARGRYKNLKELKQLYEQTYGESIEKVYDNFEKLEADRGADSWNLFNDENGGYGNRDSYRNKESKISSDTSRSYEYSGQNNKAKSTVKKKPNKNFSMSASTEEKGELVAVHNLYTDKMLDAFRLGGFPMPSIAVTKAKQGHDKYGPISVVFNKNTIPTEYFEAKPERAVGFDEIEFVVLPDNAPAQLIDRLNENGIEIKKYKAGDKADRIAALNSRPDILFSIDKNSEIDAYYGEVIRENRHWRVLANLLTDDVFAYTSKDLYIKNKDVHRIAKEIIDKTKSTYNLETLENKLMAVFEYIKASGKTIDDAEVQKALYNISYDVLSQSEMKDTELWEQYADVRKYLHDTHVYIPENVRKEIASQFGDFKSFRNQLNIA